MTTLPRLVRAREFFEKGDFLPILALVIAIQGTVLISQSIAALLLDTAMIGKIRVFESMISIGVLVAGFGAPALAIREMAAPEHIDRQGDELRNLLFLPILGAILICIAAVAATLLGASWILPLRNLLVVASLLLVAVNLVRLASAVAQGLIIVRHVYLWVIAGSFAAIALQIAGATMGNLEGWIFGRLMGELALLICMIYPMYFRLPTINWKRKLQVSALFSTMIRATIVNTGLIVRMLADASPILLLSGLIAPLRPISATAEDVGNFGIATLLLTAALLPISVITQRALPLITAKTDSNQLVEVRQFMQRISAVSVTVALLIFGFLSLIRIFDTGRFEIALTAAMGLMIAVPLKALASGVGTAMLASGELKMPVWITSGEVVAILLVFIFLVSKNAVWTAVLSVIIGSTFSLLSMLIAKRALKL